MSKRAYIYLRVSSAQQADKDYNPEGFSIPAQREACKRKAEALEAVVVDEFVDRGESAKTANRPALQAMLRQLDTERGIDYIIVHKIDRLARNRADDVAIVMQIRNAGAQVVSVSENIDETPSGLLLHGIMSSTAEFYSRNLAAEILKGSTQKAKNGGTLARAPLGYLNARDWIDGREVRTVRLDPERAPLIKEAFRLYATGDYALSELAQIMEERGVRTRPSRKSEAKAPGPNRLHQVLRNDYYIGKVRYRGEVYCGRHEPLISTSLFAEVQAVLDGRRIAGEHPQRHNHYLKGTMYCDECGGRLIYTRNRGRQGGLYDYFVCRGRQLGKCSQRHHPVELVEDAVVRRYVEVELTPERSETIKAAIRRQAEVMGPATAREIKRAQRQLAKLLDQEQKLLNKHYEGKISDRLYDLEQVRLARETEAATATIERLNSDYSVMLANV